MFSYHFSFKLLVFITSKLKTLFRKLQIVPHLKDWRPEMGKFVVLRNVEDAVEKDVAKGLEEQRNVVLVG